VADGDTTKALRDVDRALSLDPDLASAHETAAFLAFRSGDLAGAIPHFRAVIAQRPAEVRARIDLATALARTGRPADGIAELEEALRIDAGNPVAWRNLGVLKRAVGDEAGAVEAQRRMEAVRQTQDTGR
jgi:Flp pilus assembly protein TadD